MSIQTIANRYRLDELALTINHSDFYYAYDTITNTNVIVRLLHMDAVGLEAKLQRFMETEMQILKQLDHPSMLRVLDYGLENHVYYLVSEHFLLQTLQQYLQKYQKLDVASAIYYGLELADAVSRLHHIGIIHCDIKPENVLVSDKILKLVEFSIANHVLDGSYITGTPPYMSPEAIYGDNAAIPRDIWALGVTLFELLTGRLPFRVVDGNHQPEDMPSLVLKIVNDPVPNIADLQPNLPSRLIALINWMLEKAPEKRINSMRQVAAELEAIGQALRNPSQPSPITPLEQDSIIGGRYRLQKQIGQGGFGLIYRAANIETGQTVAIKQLRAEVAQNADTLQRFKREAEALLKANHPNIIKVLDTIETNDGYFLVLEYVEGGDLRGLLDVRRLPLVKTVKIALELADALARTHHLRIIHRDIKPENVLIAVDGTPRLADFGIAYMEISQRLTANDTVVGTIDYIAPEVLQGGSPSIQSDIWAFGILLYEMLTGQHPFNRPIMTQLLLAIISGNKPDLATACSDCPNELVELVNKMLERDLNHRLASMREIATRLEGILRKLEADAER
jgi:serine/threonine protein kinase